MRVTFAIIVGLMLSTATASAQERNHATRNSIAIEEPTSGEEVERPFVIRGAAPPGAVLELFTDREFRGIFRADDRGRFLIPVDAVVSQIEVRLRNAEAVASVSVRVEGARVRDVPDRGREVPQREIERMRITGPETVEPESRSPTEDERPARPPVEGGAAFEVADAILAAEVSALEEVARRETVDEAVDPFRAADSIDPFQEADRPEPKPAAVETAEAGDSVPTWNRWNAGVMIAQTLIGSAIGVAMGGGMFLVLTPGVLVVALSIGAFLGITGVVATVQALGAGWGGRSPWGYSLAGALAGVAVGALFPPALLILPGLGATVGYHMKSTQREASE